MESKVDELYVDKLVSATVDLSRLSGVVRNNVVKKDVYDNKIKSFEDKILDIFNLATNTTIDAKINDIKSKKTIITNLAFNTALNAKINEIKGEVLSITKLVTNTALTVVENKISNVSNLVKKIDYKTIINELKKITDNNHEKYITSQEFNMRKLSFKINISKFSKQK